MEEEILYEDKAVLVCHKPAGLAVQTARVGQPDLVSRLKNYLAAECQAAECQAADFQTAERRPTGHQAAGHQTAERRPINHKVRGGEPYLGVVHRLDQPVEGLLVSAKSRAAAASLSGQLTDGILNKRYLAVVWGKTDREKAALVDWLIRDAALSRAEVVTEKPPLPKAARRAVLSYEAAETIRRPEGELTLLDIRIETGRFHQIRAQLSHAGHPIFGDRKYGGEEQMRRARAMGCGAMALCASELSFIHPETGKTMAFCIAPQGAPFSWFGGKE